MDHPFIDTSKLSDDELLERMRKCQNILSVEYGMGHASMADSARMQLEVYQHEWQERMFKRVQKDYEEKNPPGTITIGSIDGETYYPENKENNKK